MNQINNSTDPYNNLGTALRHTFFRRKEVALIALSSGYTLGGSILLLLTAYLVSALHGGSYFGIALFTVETMLLLRYMWVLGKWVFSDFEPNNLGALLAVCSGGFLISLLMPIVLIISVVEVFLLDSAKTIKPKEFQEKDSQFTHLFSRMAHIR